MATTLVRVSLEAHRFLVARAKRDRLTVAVVVDALCAIEVTTASSSRPVTTARQDPHAGAITRRHIAECCARCGCRQSMHSGGAQADRCERHPTCRWTTP